MSVETPETSRDHPTMQVMLLVDHSTSYVTGKTNNAVQLSL